MQIRAVLASLALLAGTPACATLTIGPYVSDVRPLPDGALRITRCTRATGVAVIVFSADDPVCSTVTVPQVPPPAAPR
jgi:hypothetical protein